MSAFAYVYERDPDEALRLRAEDRIERQRLRPHWCSECHGKTGQGSPCRDDEEQEEEECQALK